VGRKWREAAVPLSVGELGPRLTVPPGLRPTSIPSGMLIHPTGWPQYTNVTDREKGQGSRSIGRTVTCNGRPKKPGFYMRARLLYGQKLWRRSRNKKLFHTRRHRSRCIWVGESHFQTCKTTSGRETTTSGLTKTETANTAV